MKFNLLFPAVFLLMIFAFVQGVAAETDAQSATDREQVLEEKVRELEAQLQDANRTIADLQGQLNAKSDTGGKARLADASEDSSADAASGESKRDGATAPPPSGLNLGHDQDKVDRRRQQIAETPAAITTLGPVELLLGGVEDVSRLEFLAPSLRYGQTGHDVRLAMRGARTNSIGPEVVPVVGMYEDGVYIATTTEGLNSFLDVQRIDVLRGPQITNFGQHAYAGAVSIVSNKPTFDGFSGYAEAENGLPDKTRWRLALNLPATDTLGFRVAGLSESRSGWINNSYIESDSDDLNDRKVQTLRASMLWQPSDRFSLLLWSRYQDENGTGSAPWGYQQIGAYVDGELEPGNQFAPPGFSQDYGPWDVARNFISAAEYENWVNTLDLNWDVGFASLRWLSNFTAFHGRQTYDNDYTDLGEPTSTPFAGWSTSQRGWSSELRMASNAGGAFNWLAGLYYSDRQADWGWIEAHHSEFSQPDWDIDGEYSTDTTALFGQVSYDFSNRFGVTGGLRWNKEGKTSKTGEKGKWDDVLWKAALEYDLSERTLTYVSASTGYRAGGINTAPGVNPVWEPEKLTAYELGLKTLLADGKLRMNLAGYYNDFKNVQSQSFLVMPYPGSPEATEYTGNGGPADAKGIEAEIQWLPMPQWSISTQVTYTDAGFGHYVTPTLAGLGDIPGHTDGGSLSYNGWRPALSPEWVVGLQTYYSFHLSWGSLTPYLQTTYASDYYVNDINLAGVRQGSHSKTDLRVIWLAPNSNFQLQFYYLNAEEEASLNWARVYNPAARPDITTLQANWGNPNTYGIIFNYSF
jgi:outer membrane receptor protein involved in Fe transport